MEVAVVACFQVGPGGTLTGKAHAVIAAAVFFFFFFFF